MKIKEVKTIDLRAGEYFDSINGNSYFSAIMTINSGLDSEMAISLPFQYGYGSQYEYACYNKFKECFKRVKFSSMFGFYSFCKERKIKFNSDKIENLSERMVNEFTY